jgi:alanine racemase
MTRPARVIFDPQAVQANLQVVRRCAPARRVMAIVKADGYGHGVVRMARALAAADAFGVASIEEAVRLREANITQPIVLLEGPFEAQELADITVHRLESVVHHQGQVRMFASHSAETKLWLKIDTGMHRLGFAPGEVPTVIAALARPARELRLMTHFASAHLRGDPSVEAQLRVFESLAPQSKYERCCANSSAVLAWPTSHADWVRPGIMLYGVSPFAEVTAAALGLRPAMTVTSTLIAVKQVPAGDNVGYGKGFVCPENMQVGVVAFGYADGYPRHAATGTPILVNGIRTQVIGEASMDMLAVDLRPLREPQVGDPVVLWGDGLPVEEIARAAHTIPYELLCRMRMRAPVVERQ